MKAFVDAVVYGGAVYCIDCLPQGVTTEDADVTPIFADSEWDHYPICDSCQAIHDYVSLTDYGQARQRIQETCRNTGYDNHTVTFAFAAWCQDHHSGQFSFEYRVPTLLQVRFSPLFKGRESLSEGERDVYDYLCQEEGCDHEND